jgi:N-acetylglucosaminyldiphosphoundecaprenol N-acetyl-beta-D-mannosaminyltransferase
MPLMHKAAESGWRVYYLGAEESVLQRGLANIRAQCPGISITGHNGYFDPRPDHPENNAIVQDINAYRPHVLVVGMGMGRQERWIMDNLDRLEVNGIGTSGACIEYFAGAVPTPPRWLGPIGLEWLYRLCTNPRRFAWRYLVEPWLVLGFILGHMIHKPKTKS